MAKPKKVNKVKRVVKVDNRLSILLLVLAFLIFALAAVAMNDSSKSQIVTNSNPVKVVATPTVKPVVKTIKK